MTHPLAALLAGVPRYPYTVEDNDPENQYGWDTVEVVFLSDVLAALSAAPVGVRVRELVWVQNSGGVWEARTAFGTSYSVADRQWSYGPARVWFWVEEGDDAAKAAAQADYEARIMAALTPAPAKPEGRRDDEVRRAALMEALQALRGAGSFGRTAAEKHAALEQYCLCRDAILALIEKDTK